MTVFSQLLARPEFAPVWTVEFACAQQTIAALPDSAATPAGIIALPGTGGGTFDAFPSTGYAEIVGADDTGRPDCRREIVRYTGKNEDGTALTGVIRGRFATPSPGANGDWAEGSVLREIGLPRVFSTLPSPAWPQALPLLLEPTLGSQALDDERLTATVSSFAFRLADADNLIAKTLAVTPMRERAVTLKLGFAGLASPDEFRVLARGRVKEVLSDDGGASWKFQCRGVFGEVKDQRIFLDRRSRLTTGMTPFQTTIPVRDTDRFLTTADVSPRYAKLGDEIVSYTGLSATSGPGDLTGCTRGLFLSVPAAHDADDEIRQLYEFGGHPLTVLLNLLTTTGTGGNGD